MSILQREEQLQMRQSVDNQYGQGIAQPQFFQISAQILNSMIRVIEANSEEIIEKWLSHFGEIRYFC